MTNSPKHAEIRDRMEEIGIIPSIRTRSADGARFAAETVADAGIPVVEITMTVPDALRVVADLRRQMPDMIVGVDSAWDLEGARRAVDAGAMFVTSPGLDSRSIVEFVIQEDLVVIPGALTPSELSTAWQAGADFVKVFPCHSMGGLDTSGRCMHRFPRFRWWRQAASIKSMPTTSSQAGRSLLASAQSSFPGTPSSLAIVAGLRNWHGGF